MSLDQLTEMRNQIDEILREKIAAERDQLQSRLEALNAFGLSGERKGRRGRRASNGLHRVHPLKGRKAPIKYRGPDGQTWSGRGLPPRWLADLEKKGRKRDSFLVEKPQ
jgi:DNA-binding protein H-NS